MPNLLSRSRRLLVAGGFVVAVAAAPAAAFIAIPSSAGAPVVTACPAGETEDLYTDNCTPELSPNVAGGAYPTVPAGGTVPEVQGVPCTGRNTGECIGLQESEGNMPMVTPHSELSSSP